MTGIAIIGKRDYKKNNNYYRVVEELGFEPVGIYEEGLLHLLPECGIVIIPGGADINPELYGQKNISSREIDDERDRFEWKVLEKSIASGIPVLGICRGMQMINIFFGGSLNQDLQTSVTHTQVDECDSRHSTCAKESGFVYRVFGKADITTNSAHHQGISVLGNGLEAVQFAEDGTIEAIQHQDYPIYGVQWHPERMCLGFSRPDMDDGLKLFRYFFK